MTKTFIAFVDLLGTRYRAEHDPSDYHESVTRFQQEISNGSSLLGDQASIYVFSDCAYVQSSRLDSLIRFLRELRMSLLNSSYYMKGSIRCGNLGATDAHGGVLIKDPKTVDKRMAIVHGTSFGKQVAFLYSAHEKLKGIGIAVDPEVRSASSSRAFWADSFHIVGREAGEEFIDVSFEPESITADLLHQTMGDLLRASTRSRNLAKYYISLLITWVRSTDFSAMEMDALGYDLPGSRTPPIYNSLLRSKFGLHLSSLLGVEYLWIALLDKIYTDCGETGASTGISELVARRKGVLRVLERAPVSMLNPMNRERLERYLAKSLVVPRKPSTSQRRSAATRN